MAEKKIILAVDDMPENLMLLGSLLDEYFDVRLAKSAKLALELLSGTKVDLILLDIEMPGMSGFQFLEVLREKDEKNNRAPVIFVTSHADSDFIEKAIVAGARDYLLKPVVTETLYKKIDNIIGMPKHKASSVEGKLDILLDAVSSGDIASAKNLVKELTEQGKKETPFFRVVIGDVEKCITNLEYKKAIDKIIELQENRSLNKK